MNAAAEKLQLSMFRVICFVAPATAVNWETIKDESGELKSRGSSDTVKFIHAVVMRCHTMCFCDIILMFPCLHC